MKKNKHEYIDSRMKALNRVPFLLDAMDSQGWDFTALCRMFVETVGYKSCWIALMNDEGKIKNFAVFIKEEIFKQSRDYSEILFSDFVSDCLTYTGDYLLNVDPILDYTDNTNYDFDEQLHSMTFKLSYNNFIYGILSITQDGKYDTIKEELLIVSEAVKTISFFLYDIDVRDKVKDIVVTIFETTGTGTAIFEEDTIISYANSEFEKLSGYTKEEIEGKLSWTQFIVKEDVEMMLEYHRKRRINPHSAPRNYEFRFLDRFNRVKNIYMTIDMVPRSKVSIASFLNVTEKKQLESEILRISELERQQIGNDLHDGLSPHLVGVQFMLKVLRQKIDSGTMPSNEEILEIEDQISSAVDQTRKLIKGFKPVDIQPDGLIFAIDELIEKTRSIYGITCTLNYDKNISIDSHIVATHLYYIVQEAVNNIVKHSKADEFDITIKKEGYIMVVTIEDNGIGLPTLPDTVKGMGLNIMKYRASIVNGTITFSKGEKGGTLITCSLKA